MKIFSLITLTIVLLGSSVARATWFTNSTSVLIPDGSILGVESGITSSGLASTIQSVFVNLFISGGRNGDLFVYLTHDNATAILLNRVGRGDEAGGYSHTGFQVMIQDGSPDIHTYATNSPTYNAGRLTGTWGPDARAVSPFDSTTSSDRTSFFSTFTNGAANGSWTLFLADVNGNSLESTLDSWELNIEAVPEPVNVALGIFGGLFATVQGIRYWKRKRAATA